MARRANNSVGRKSRGESSNKSNSKRSTSFSKGGSDSKKTFGKASTGGSSFSKNTFSKFDKREKNERDKEDFKSKQLEKSASKRWMKKPVVKKVEPLNEKDTGLTRLNKYLANAGICSRREADELIATGAVKVNGKIITEMGFKVSATDDVNYGGETLAKERLVYLVINKPKDYITTSDDPKDRRTVFEIIKNACKERVYPVGRLDRNTTGVLMFTNDGDLTKRLTHPSSKVRQMYHVELDKTLKSGDLKDLEEGVTIEGEVIKAENISYVANGVDKRQVGLEVFSAKNNAVRKMFESKGYIVKKLDRVVFGSLTKKDLPKGRWRLLTEADINTLRMISSSKKKG